MCKYCEFNDKLSLKQSASYATPKGQFCIYRTLDGKYILGCEFDNGTDYYPWENVMINYCPYCGRELG